MRLIVVYVCVAGPMGRTQYIIKSVNLGICVVPVNNVGLLVYISLGN